MLVLLISALVASSAPPVDTVRVTDPTQRRRASAVSEWYGTRLRIHQIGAFAELPVFAAQYVVGQRIYSRPLANESLRDAHEALALTTGVLFTSNTVTGLWNLWEARKEPAGRTRRILHASLMLAADAGFLATAALADDDAPGGSGARRHRQAAIASISLSTVATVMMWVWRD